jgi:PIN domain nuclease of toxin-antitoxin system
VSLVLDTHAAIWYFHSPKGLSSSALQNVLHSGRPVFISAISLVETIYFVGRGRLPFEALRRLEAATRAPASGRLVQSVDEAVAEAVYKIPRDVAPDIPDRLIAATALHLDLPLVTRDGRLQGAPIKTIW